MLTRIIQHPHAKCNVCFNWFQVKANEKDSLYFCESCLEKAMNPPSFKVFSLSGQIFYKMYLIPSHLTLEGFVCYNLNMKNSLIQELEQIRDKQLQQLLDKWDNIAKQLEQIKSISVEQVEHYRGLFNDAKEDPLLPTSSKLSQTKKGNITPLKNKNQAFTTVRKKEDKGNEDSLYSPLKLLNPKRAVSPIGKNDIQGKEKQNSPLVNTSIYYQRENQVYRSEIYGGKDSFMKNQKTHQLKKSDISQKSYKISKDLQAIKQDALKSKIYTYLQSQTTVPPALYLVMTLQIYDAIKNTNNSNKCLELVLFNISEVDIRCYLTMLDWTDVEILKLVKVGLTDEQLCILLDFIQDKQVQTLVVTSNKLTEGSCRQLLERDIEGLRNIYLGKNKILRFKVKEEMKELEEKYHVYL